MEEEGRRNGEKEGRGREEEWEEEGRNKRNEKGGIAKGRRNVRKERRNWRKLRDIKE